MQLSDAGDHRRQAPATPGSSTRRQPSAWPSGLRERLAGPGGLYNVGNALGLAGGLAIAVAGAGGTAGPTLESGIDAVLDYLAGSASSVAITVAMVIFFVSGEAYHRAWARGFPPVPRLNRRGDLLSGYGAIALGVGLALLGEPLLALTAGLLHALGKFGSALDGPAARRLKRLRPDPCRTAVLVSRLPAIALVLATLFAAAGGAARVEPAEAATAGLLLVCYLLWSAADIRLFGSD
jgi:hypothetical protein